MPYNQIIKYIFNLENISITSSLGHLPMIVLLMKFGADPTYKDGEGCNCLHLAAQLGHTAIVAYLVAKGCDVNGPDANGMSPVMWSCFRSTSGVDPTRLLLRVSINMRTLGLFGVNFNRIFSLSLFKYCLLTARCISYSDWLNSW